MRWKAGRDPLGILGRRLTEREVADEVALKELEERVADEVEAGERFALDAPYPDPSQVDRHVYA